MKVLIVEPGKHPRVEEIGDDLSSMQKVVGGLIEPIYPYRDPVALVCNEEGKLRGLALNRVLRDDAGNAYDFIAGTFFICGLGEDDFCPLDEEYIKKYTKSFWEPVYLFQA